TASVPIPSGSSRFSQASPSEVQNIPGYATHSSPTCWKSDGGSSHGGCARSASVSSKSHNPVYVPMSQSHATLHAPPPLSPSSATSVHRGPFATAGTSALGGAACSTHIAGCNIDSVTPTATPPAAALTHPSSSSGRHVPASSTHKRPSLTPADWSPDSSGGRSVPSRRSQLPSGIDLHWDVPWFPLVSKTVTVSGSPGRMSRTIQPNVISSVGISSHSSRSVDDQTAGRPTM